MRRVLLLFLVLFLFQPAFAFQGYDSLLVRLNHMLDKKNDYDAGKLARIGKLQQYLNDAASPDLNFRYNIYLKFYEEYKSFNYNKAFDYAKKLQQTGILLKDPAKIAISRIKFGFILLSAGMFKETFD